MAGLSGDDVIGKVVTDLYWISQKGSAANSRKVNGWQHQTVGARRMECLPTGHVSDIVR